MASEFRPLPGPSSAEVRRSIPELKPAPTASKRKAIGAGGETSLDRAMQRADLHRVLDGLDISRRLRSLEGA